MIYIDPPLDYHGKFKGCSHMVSDLHGEAGTQELLEFAKRIGWCERDWSAGDGQHLARKAWTGADRN